MQNKSSLLGRLVVNKNKTGRYAALVSASHLIFHNNEILNQVQDDNRIVKENFYEKRK